MGEMPPKLSNGDPSLSLGLAGLSGIGRFDPSRWSPVAIRETRARKRRSTYICRIDVMGVAAVLFTLFLIVASPYSVVVDPSAGADLVTAQSARLTPAALREDAMHVMVTRDGTVYFNKHRAAPDELPSKIHEWVNSGAERRVYISADARSRYSEVKTVLEQIRLAGVENVTFLAQSGPDTSSK
jgi:biopolymer transport protein ExbD